MKRWNLGVPEPIGRRRLLAGASAALLIAAIDGCSVGVLGAQRRTASAASLQLAPLRAGTDRITQITVCTRPFRDQGPRLDVEQIGQKIIVHNYGHGGSGWSLSWGSSDVVVRKALEAANGNGGEAILCCVSPGLA